MLYLAAALYTACGVSAGVAAMLAAMTTSAVVERLNRQDETLRQVVAELARLRAMHRETAPTIGLDYESIEAARTIARRLLESPN